MPKMGWPSDLHGKMNLNLHQRYLRKSKVLALYDCWRRGRLVIEKLLDASLEGEGEEAGGADQDGIFLDPGWRRSNFIFLSDTQKLKV